MVKQHIANAKFGLIVTGMAALLVGCSGTTYGTGVSTEKQLFDDVTGIMSLGAQRDKPRIDYSSRPKLVKAPNAGTLPTPAETVSTESPYFPTDPEERRAKLEEVDPLVRDGTPLGATRAGPVPTRARATRDSFRHLDHQPSAAQMQRESVQGAAERRKRMAEVNGGLRTGAKRKYLTQPPIEYRTPAETAPVGNLGEPEKAAKKKPSKSFNPFEGIFGS